MKYEKIIDLLREVEKSGVEEFELEKENFRIRIKNHPEAAGNRRGKHSRMPRFMVPAERPKMQKCLSRRERS